MTSIRDYSTTAASNSSVGGVSIAEGCASANLNNMGRAIMADLASYRALLEGAKTTAGTANAQTLTTGLSISSYAVPLMFAAKIGAALSNTTAMTLALDSLAAKSVKMLDASDPPAGAVKAGAVHLFAYEASADCIFLLTPFISVLNDPGSNGLLARTAANTVTPRTLTAPAAGITVSNGDGVSGNPTLALANDLAALEALSTTGIISRTASETYAQRTITGTANRVTVTNGDGVAGNPTLDLGTNAAVLNVEDQALTGGAIVTSKSLGTLSSGTTTLDMGARPLQHATNGGAFTLAPGTNNGACVLDITNNGSAGTITTSGWTKVAGDSFDTTNAHAFRCHCSVGNAGSLLIVQAMQ